MLAPGCSAAWALVLRPVVTSRDTSGGKVACRSRLLTCNEENNTVSCHALRRQKLCTLWVESAGRPHKMSWARQPTAPR